MAELEYQSIFLTDENNWCIGIDGEKVINGSKIQLQESTEEDGQMWHYDGTHLRNKINPKKVLTVAKKGGIKDGAILWMWTPKEKLADLQHWVYDEEEGFLKLKSSEDGLCISIQEGPFAVCWHTHDGIFGEFYWDRAQADAKFKEMNGGPHATVMYDRNIEIQRAYGARSARGFLHEWATTEFEDTEGEIRAEGRPIELGVGEGTNQHWSIEWENPEEEEEMAEYDDIVVGDPDEDGFVEVVIGPHLVQREDGEDVEPKRFTCPSEIPDGVYEIQPEDRVNPDYADSGDSFRVEVEGDSLICTRTDREGYGWGMNLAVRLPLFNEEEVEAAEEEEEVAEEEEEPEVDPMDLAEAIMEMRDIIKEAFGDEEKMMEILNVVDSIDSLEGAVSEAVQAAADEFVAGNDILTKSGSIEKPVAKIMEDYVLAYEAKMEEKIQELIDAVFGEFAQNFMEAAIDQCEDSEDNMNEVVEEMVNEEAEEFVEGDDFLSAKGVPEGCLDEHLAATQEAFTNEFVERATNEQEAAVVAAAATLYAECTTARNTQYLFEMGRESVDQEEFDKTPVEEALQALVERVEEIAELDVGRLEAGERENALAFWKGARAYALEEASYLRTRADRTEQKGSRHPSESYSQIRAIEGNVEKRLEALTIYYDDDTFRKYGVDDQVSFNIITEELEPGEKIVRIDCWDTKHRDSVAEGIRFHTSNDREISFIGKKAKGLFGLDSIDHKWRDDGDYIIEMEWGERDNQYHPEGAVYRSNDHKPGGDWEEAVDEWRFVGNKLVYTLEGRTSYFIPLPWETLKIENGMMLVDARLMDN